MHGDALRAIVLAVMSGAVGGIGWSGNTLALPVAMLFPMLWSLARTRTTAALVSLAYFLAASRGLPQGVATYHGADLWPGLMLWFAASSAFVLVHLCLWSGQKGLRVAFGYSLACVLMAVPPFGVVGWAHPWTAAGVLFPGWGWAGLGMTAILLATFASRARLYAVAVIVGLWSCAAYSFNAPTTPDGWHGIDTHMGASLGRDLGLERQRGLAAMLLDRSDAKVLILPESALGYWTPTVQRLWQRQLSGTGITLIAGAAVVDPHGYDNVLVKISEHDGSMLYRERMPVPGSMWQPWLLWLGEPGSARANFFANPVVSVGATRVAPLICYEQLIIWPILQSILFDPDVIVAVGNGWWTAGTSIVNIQTASATAWAMLFGKPLVTSVNF